MGPSLDVQISERSSLVFASQLLDVSYTGAEFEGRVDFTDTEVSAGILRRVDGRNEVSARLVGSEYDADLNENETKTFGVEGTFERALIRDWSFNLQAGVSRSDYSFLNDQLQPVDNADTSFTYQLGFRQRTERNTINIDLSQETTPNSSGFLTLRDELHVYVSRAMTRRLHGEVGLRGYASKTLDDVIDNDERDYWRMDLGMEWAMTEQLFLNGGYAFTKQQFAAESPTHRRTTYSSASFTVDVRVSSEGTGMAGTRSFTDGKTERICGLIAAIHPGIKTLLVVGCGKGIEAAILAEALGAAVTGIDTQTISTPARGRSQTFESETRWLSIFPTRVSTSCTAITPWSTSVSPPWPFVRWPASSSGMAATGSALRIVRDCSATSVARAHRLRKRCSGT